MISVNGNVIDMEGDTKTLMAEYSKALFAFIRAQSRASHKPFKDTAEWMITLMTKTVLNANEQLERESK